MGKILNEVALSVKLLGEIYTLSRFQIEIQVTT